VNEYIGHVIACDVDATDLVHGLHPSSQDHAADNARGTLAGEELPPRIFDSVLGVQDALDDGELCLYRGRLGCRTVAFERCQDFACVVVAALSDE